MATRFSLGGGGRRVCQDRCCTREGAEPRLVRIGAVLQNEDQVSVAGLWEKVI
jgi:hypothetical protein